MSATVTVSPVSDHAAPRASVVTPRVRNEEATRARLLGQPVRLGILRALLGTETMSFVELKHLMNTTDGNLSMHARKLEDAQILACSKGFQGRFPRTEYRLTPAGREIALDYLKQIEQ
jgi:DNA-binding HxlR family transcriptional regulator